MEYDKINNLLDSESENLFKFVTRQYVKVNSLSNTYNENNSHYEAWSYKKRKHKKVDLKHLC